MVGSLVRMTVVKRFGENPNPSPEPSLNAVRPARVRPPSRAAASGTRPPRCSVCRHVCLPAWGGGVREGSGPVGESHLTCQRWGRPRALAGRLAPRELCPCVQCGVVTPIRPSGAGCGLPESRGVLGVFTLAPHPSPPGSLPPPPQSDRAMDSSVIPCPKCEKLLTCVGEEPTVCECGAVVRMGVVDGTQAGEAPPAPEGSTAPPHTSEDTSSVSEEVRMGEGAPPAVWDTVTGRGLVWLWWSPCVRARRWQTKPGSTAETKDPAIGALRFRCVWAGSGGGSGAEPTRVADPTAACRARVRPSRLPSPPPPSS